MDIKGNKGRWNLTSSPAANTQATASKAADAQGKHVCMSISWSIANDGTNASVQDIRLIDGGTGGSTILWEIAVTVKANETQAGNVNFGPLGIAGSKNTKMTVEFNAAAGASSFESVNANGYTEMDLG